MSGIRIEGLSKRYMAGGDKTPAVYDLSLQIAENQFITILGPSGCGKTTTLRLIAGFLKPDSGVIEVGGRILSTPDEVVPPERRGMGMVFQNYAIWPHLSVYENVVFGLKLRRAGAEEARRRANDVLELVNLAGLGSRQPNQLSGGQQQRVALARSLVVEPDILLLDEPLSNLDAKLRERMRSELKQLQRRTGITFIYVTHDQSEALALSDRIAVMDEGVLQQFGTPQEIYERPASRAVANFMRQINLLAGRIVAVNGSRGMVRTADGLSVEAELPGGTSAADAVQLGVRPENVALAPPGSGNGEVRGRIVDATYYGNLIEYQVRLPTGSMLRVESHPRFSYPPGSEVAISLDGFEVTVFAAD